MPRLKKKLIRIKPLYRFLGVGFIAVLICLMVTPAFFRYWFRSQQTTSILRFLNESAAIGAIDAHRFYELRDRYSTTNWEINEDAVRLGTAPTIYQLDPPITKLLSISDVDFSATESVMTASFAPTYLAQVSSQKDLLSTSQDIITRLNTGFVKVTLIRPVAEMKQVFGVFDYVEAEQQLLADQVWVSETILLDLPL